jgi:hypothetical protein
MEPSARRAAAWSAPPGLRSAVVISALLIFLGLLGIGNEIRFQGCVARQDQQALIAATENPRNPAPVELECHRLPFR